MYKVIKTIINIVLWVLYGIFAYTVTCMFDFLPWYDPSQSYLANFTSLWIPLCVVTLIRIMAAVLAKKFDRAIIMLACINALYIPLIYLLGFVGITLTWLKVIGIIGIVTMIIYVIVSIIKKTK